MTVPTFLVAGAGRSGTTALVEGLRTHPDLFVTSPKEPHYFGLHGQKVDYRGPGDMATINRVAVTDRHAYLGLYPANHSYSALGDGSVSTLYYAEAAAPEIVRVNPDMRVVVLLREPVDRAFSSYSYMRARGFEPHEDFLAAVAEEPRRQAENWHHLWHYVAMSHYASSLRILLDTLGPDQLGIWFYDDIEKDYEGTVRSVLRFLGLPVREDEAVGVPRVNVSGTPRLAVAQRAIWAATRNEVLRTSVKRLTSFRFREGIRRLTLAKAAVPPVARAALEELFVEDLRQVAALIDTPAPPWLTIHRPT
jgi:hypothetical protein